MRTGRNLHFAGPNVRHNVRHNFPPILSKYFLFSSQACFNYFLPMIGLVRYNTVVLETGRGSVRSKFMDGIVKRDRSTKKRFEPAEVYTMPVRMTTRSQVLLLNSGKRRLNEAVSLNNSIKRVASCR